MIITAGKFKGRKIEIAKNKLVKPTLSKARQGIFDCLRFVIDFEKSSFLDLFAGSAIMGIEALSRGFLNLTSIEKEPQIVEIIKKNYKKLGIKADLKVKNALSFLKNCEKKFDCIFVDPPYNSGIYEEIANLIFERKILSKNGILILEMPEKLDFLTNKFKLFKQKNYSSSKVLFLKNLN